MYSNYFVLLRYSSSSLFEKLSDIQHYSPPQHHSESYSLYCLHVQYVYTCAAEMRNMSVVKILLAYPPWSTFELLLNISRWRGVQSLKTFINCPAFAKPWLRFSFFHFYNFMSNIGSGYLTFLSNYGLIYMQNQRQICQISAFS